MIVGLDVGGTHTDVVLLEKEGLRSTVKVPTDHGDLLRTVTQGLEGALKDVNPDAIERVVLSTTLTTNVMVAGDAPPVGVLVAGGAGMDPLGFKVGDHYHCLSGAMDHRGREITPLDPDQIQTLGEQLNAAGIRHLAVIGKFSVRNPSHEQQIEDLLNGQFEKIFLGHRVSGHLNFPRRITTTYLNAAVYPLHLRFYDAVKRTLAAKGMSAPLHILKADGGTMSLEASMENPAQTILSGPAASVMGALPSAPPVGDVLVLDIGGTTTDMALLTDCVPLLEPVGIRIGRCKTLIRALKTHSLALGGDSALSVAAGKLMIGPGRQGPALAFGGPAPTPTDALVVLGTFDEGDRGRAEAGIAGLAAALGMDTEPMARRVLAQMCQEILSAAQAMVNRVNQRPVYTVHELKEGVRIQPRTILVLGGPAPQFAAQLGALSDCTVSTVPRWQVANAIGAALARTTCDVTVQADTQQGWVRAPEEAYYGETHSGYSRRDVLSLAEDLLCKKARRLGARSAHQLPLDILEDLSFTMVRGFNTVGRNIRVKMQVRPGLIDAPHTIAALSADPPVDGK
jgi:N-methylhydantoinase A/oxoprolinase/acetone carboxylase beta subunit